MKKLGKIIYWHNKHKIEIIQETSGDHSSYTVGITGIIYAPDNHLILKVHWDNKDFTWKTGNNLGKIEIDFSNKVFQRVEDLILENYLGYKGLNSCKLCGRECLYRPENLCKKCMISEGIIDTNNKRLIPRKIEN